MRRCWRREEVQESQGPRVQGSQSLKDQDISKSNSNTSLTLKKVHLVLSFLASDSVGMIYMRSNLIDNLIWVLSVHV